MSSFGSPMHTIVRVKRRADEDRGMSYKRCKFVGTCDSGDDKDIELLLSSTQILPQIEVKDKKQLKICDLEDVLDSMVFVVKPKDIITCNGQPLESVDNQLDESMQYLYDIYVLDDTECLHMDDKLQYRDGDDSEDDSNHENYAYNDYPDEDEVSEDVIDYYSYREDKNDCQRNDILSDYDFNDEDIDAIDRLDLKNRDFDEYEDEEKEEDY